jgi:hypothetical protein
MRTPFGAFIGPCTLPVLGRNDQTLRDLAKYASVSGQHLNIELSETGIFATDLNSTGGTCACRPVDPRKLVPPAVAEQIELAATVPLPPGAPLQPGMGFGVSVISQLGLLGIPGDPLYPYAKHAIAGGAKLAVLYLGRERSYVSVDMLVPGVQRKFQFTEELVVLGKPRSEAQHWLLAIQRHEVTEAEALEGIDDSLTMAVVAAELLPVQ